MHPICNVRSAHAHIGIPSKFKKQNIMRNLFTHLFNFSEKDQVGTKLSSKKDQVRQNGREGSLARFLWVYKYTHLGVKSAKSMSAGSEAEGRETLGRGSIEHPLSIHSASIEHPLQVGGNKEASPMRVLRYAAAVALFLCLGVGEMWGGTITWSFANSGSKVDLNSASKPYSFTGSDGSTILYYNAAASGDELAASGTYIKINGASGVSSNIYNTRYFTFTAPSSSGTLTFEYAGTAGTTLISTGTNGTVIQETVTGTANSSVTSSVISGLTAGTTIIYLQNVSKSYFKSITWTDADAPSYSRAYYSLVKTTMETGASVAGSSASQQSGGSGLYADFANYFKTSSSTGSMTITFSPAITLNSNGSNRGAIKIYYGHTSAGNGAALEVNNSNIGSVSATIANRIYSYTYTIPDGTTSLSSINATGSGSSGFYICAIEVLTYAEAPASGWTVRSNYTDNNWSTNRVTMTGSTTVTGTWNITTAGLYEFKMVDTSTDTWYGNT